MIGERGKEIVLPCLDGLARIPIMRSERETMGFADGILTEDLEPLRQRLLTHLLWTGIEQGTLPRGTHIKTLLINLDNGPEKIIAGVPSLCNACWNLSSDIRSLFV